MRFLLLALVALIAVTASACGSAEKDYAKYLNDQCQQFLMVASEPQTENWSPTPSSLRQTYERLHEMDQNLREVRAPTERTKALAHGLQLLVHGLETATLRALGMPSLPDSTLYYRAAAEVIGAQLSTGDVYSDIGSLAMKLGAVTTTTGYSR